MPPLTIMLKPASSLCNMRCAYCFYSDVAARRDAPSYGVMSPGTLETLVRRAFAYAEGSLSFIFQGGEPTLAGKEFFEAFLSLLARYNARRLRVSLALQTNGLTLDEEWCALLKRGGFLVGVSLDGTQALHDACRRGASGEPTYARVIRGIELLRRFGVDYNVLCVVTQPVAERPEEVFHALKAHRFLQFIPCLDGFDGKKTPLSLDAETYGRFLIGTFDLYEQAWYAGKPVSIRNLDNWLAMLLGYPPENCAMSGRCGHYFLVEADGGVYPCDFYVLDRWRLGNVGDASFFKLDKSPVGARFREESVPLPEGCARCEWFSLCRGGCKRDREPIAGGEPGAAGANRLCAGHKLFFSSRFERIKALAAFVGKTSR